jgi:O-antigen ligase
MASSLLSTPHISITRNTVQLLKPNSVDTLYHRIDVFSSYRLSSIEQAIYSFNLDNLLFGVGFGNALTYTPKYEEIGFFEIHNLILKHLFELGVLGGILTATILIFPLAFSVSQNQSSVLKKNAHRLVCYMRFDR